MFGSLLGAGTISRERPTGVGVTTAERVDGPAAQAVPRGDAPVDRQPPPRPRSGTAALVGVALVALAGISFAVQSILAKTAYARGADVPTVLAVRFAVATAAVWGVAWLSRGRGVAPPPPLPTRRRLGLGLLGLLFVTNALFAYLALDRLPAGTATLLIYVFPALVALWSRLFFGERLTRAKVAALALALVGYALTVDPVAALGAGAGLSWVGVGLSLIHI